MQHGFTRGRGEGAGSYPVSPVVFAHGRRPTFAVILTEVRIQSCGRWRLGLWILTFVRMTGGVDGRAAGRGFAARPLGCLVRGGCPMLVVILTEVRIQGYGRGWLGLWVLTFVRMTGVLLVGLRGLDAQRGRLVAGPWRPPDPCRHPDGGQDPGLRAGALAGLGPDFRQDDGRGMDQWTKRATTSR